MTILLVGETIDRRRAHAQASAGELVQLVRGVYGQANADVDTAVLAHAVRIAHYLYPAAYLSSASAALLRPTSDGRVFLSGRRNQHTRIRTLEIVQNEAPAHPSTAPAIVGDDQGEIRIEVSSPRQRFLEAFRLRSEHASAITDELRADMAARLVEEFGSPQAAADALWALARENGWYREGEGAERYLTTRPAVGKAAANKAALERIVAWHGEPLGRLTHDGFEWRWKAAANTAPPLVRQTAPVVPDAALVGMPDGMAPALVVERFDIRRDKADKRRLALEDFCSVLDLPASAKYDGTIERVARGLRPLSTDPADDLDILFRRALFAWLIADGDMHLKNLALLRVAAPGARQFESVRFAPLYDAVTTRVFPGLASDRMALKLNEKDERLAPRDFLTLARTIELSIARAEEAMASVTAATRKAAGTISLPEMARDGEGANSIEKRVKAIVAERCDAFA